MRYKFLFLVCLLLIAAVWSESNLNCPRPRVRKRTIILSNQSLNNGARLISNDQVESARQCYALCCKDTTCNVAVMHYKQKKNDLEQDVTAKYCFLFDCGSPSVCTYDYHRRYAIIDLPRRRKLPSFTTSTTTTSTTSTPNTEEENKSTTVIDKEKAATKCIEACPYDYDPVCGSDGKSYDNQCLFKLAQCKQPSIKMAYAAVCRECPPGVAMAMCSDDPCTLIKCPAHKDAVCKANFCGGCNAVYSNSKGVKVNCSHSDVVVSDDHNEQSVTVGETDYTETLEESLPIDKIHPVDGHKEEKNDPYYNSERRHWLPHNHTGGATTAPISNMPVAVVVSDATLGSSLMSLPLLIALIICIILLIGVIYRVKCVHRGRAKKLPVDDGDYLINGMYL